jgi:hypothetical protein
MCRQHRCRRPMPLDRLLCVTAFRRFCLYQLCSGLKMSPEAPLQVACQNFSYYKNHELRYFSGRPRRGGLSPAHDSPDSIPRHNDQWRRFATSPSTDSGITRRAPALAAKPRRQRIQSSCSQSTTPGLPTRSAPSGMTQ